MQQKIFAGKTDIGHVRSKNEDHYLISPEHIFCAVADGMGGAAAGEIASQFFIDTASEILSENFSRSEDEVSYRVKKIFSFANERILEYANKNPGHEGMGCTAELLAFYDKGFILGHIGDSRTYLFRKGYLKQITKDHTIIQQQVEAGIISPENTKNHPLRNVLIQAVGHNKELSLDIFRGDIFHEDLFLLCSDGLTDMLDTDQIEEIIRSDIDIDRKATELIDWSKKAGGSDNITVVIVTIK